MVVNDHNVCEVTHSSGGIEPPPGAVCPSKSLYTVYFSLIEFTMKLIKKHYADSQIILA